MRSVVVVVVVVAKVIVVAVVVTLVIIIAVAVAITHLAAMRFRHRTVLTVASYLDRRDLPWSSFLCAYCTCIRKNETHLTEPVQNTRW